MDDPAGGQGEWIRDAPGAVLGCIYIEESYRFEPGSHYYWHYGKIERLPTASPPTELITGFADALGQDVGTKDQCQ